MSFRDAAIGSSDFAYVWLGPRTLLDGGDPYNAAAWSASLARLGTSPGGTLSVYSYPPYVAAALLPLGALPLAVAYGVWTWSGVAFAALSLWALLRTFAPDHRAIHAVAPAALFLSEPAIESFYGGQWSLLLTGGAAVLAVALAGRATPLAVLGTLVLSAKPHVTAVALAGLLWRAVRRGERRSALAIAGTVVFLVVATAVLGWPAVVAWLTELPKVRPAEVYVATLPAAVGPIATGVIVLLALAAALRVNARDVASAAPWFALSVLAAPYAHPYEHLPLLVPLVIVTRSRPSVALIGTVVFLVLPWVLFLTISRTAGFERASVIVPVICYGLVSFALFAPSPRSAALKES